MNKLQYAGTLLGALALATSILGPHAHPAAAQPTGTTQYTFQTVSSPNDPTFTQLLGINDRQIIAGYYGSGQTINGTVHPNKGFTLSLPSTFTPENYPGSAQTQVIAINNQGDTGGFYVDTGGVTHGFVRVNGRFRTVDRPGTTFNQILGLNNRGQAAGYYQDAQGRSHAYIREANGTFQLLPLADSQTTGINDAGVIVGFSQPSATTSAGFIVKGGELSILIYPGSTFTQALGENNTGQVVGLYNDSAGSTHGFVYDMRTRAFQPVDEPGAGATTINGINDSGRIVGFFTDANGNTVGIAGTPQTGQGTTQGQSAMINIGLVLPLTGQDAGLGLSAENGARLAIDQANAGHLVPGVTFALSAKDDSGATGLPDTATGTADVTALINDARVAGIIGPFDITTALTELPLANRAGIAMISPSAGNPCLTGDDLVIGCSGANSLLASVRPTGNVTFFRTIATDVRQGRGQADYLYTGPNYRTAYVIDDAAPYGIGVANAFSDEWKNLGGVVRGHSSQPESTQSYVNLLTQIAATKPDVIFFGGSDPTSGTPASIRIRQQMVQVPALKNTAFAGGDGIRTQQFAQAIGLIGGPVWSTLTPADVTTLPSAATFVQQYQAAYGAPGRYSASGYDSASVLLAAIKVAMMGKAQPPTGGATGMAQAFRKMVIADLAQTNVNGVTAPISFTASGDVAMPLISIERLASVNNAAGWTQVTNR